MEWGDSIWTYYCCFSRFQTSLWSAVKSCHSSKHTNIKLTFVERPWLNSVCECFVSLKMTIVHQLTLDERFPVHCIGTTKSLIYNRMNESVQFNNTKRSTAPSLFICLLWKKVMEVSFSGCILKCIPITPQKADLKWWIVCTVQKFKF